MNPLSLCRATVAIVDEEESLTRGRSTRRVVMRGPDGQRTGEAKPRGDAAPVPHVHPADGGELAQPSIDHHEEYPPHNAWRRLWRVGRVGLVGSAIIVVSANLIRCLAVVPASGRVIPRAIDKATPVPEAGAPKNPPAISSSEEEANATPLPPRSVAVPVEKEGDLSGRHH